MDRCAASKSAKRAISMNLSTVVFKGRPLSTMMPPTSKVLNCCKRVRYLGSCWLPWHRPSRTSMSQGVSRDSFEPCRLDCALPASVRIINGAAFVVAVSTEGTTAASF